MIKNIEDNPILTAIKDQVSEYVYGQIALSITKSYGFVTKLYKGKYTIEGKDRFKIEIDKKEPNCSRKYYTKNLKNKTEMKIRFCNGVSISLWETEFEELKIEEGLVSYLSKSKQWIKISVPSLWIRDASAVTTVESSSSSTQSIPCIDNPVTSQNPPQVKNDNEKKFKDIEEDISKLKLSLTQVKEVQYCTMDYAQPKFNFIKNTFDEIQTHYNKMRSKISNIEKYLAGEIEFQKMSQIDNFGSQEVIQIQDSQESKTQTKEKRKKK